MSDCLAILRAGQCEPAEWENGSWRYRVRTNRMYCVVTFVSDETLCIITAWRLPANASSKGKRS